MTINERIRRILAEKKWRDKDLADALKMTKATMSQRFSKNNWTVDDLKAIALETGYSLYWICDEYGPELERDLFEAVELYANMNGAAEGKAPYATTDAYTKIQKAKIEALFSYVAELNARITQLESQPDKGKQKKTKI